MYIIFCMFLLMVSELFIRINFILIKKTNSMNSLEFYETQKLLSKFMLLKIL